MTSLPLIGISVHWLIISEVIMSVVYKIEEEFSLGELSFRQIAEKYKMSIADIELIFDAFMKTMADAY